MPSLSASRPAFAVGAAYEDGLDAGARKRGAHFTPPDVAASLAGRVLQRWRGAGAPLVCDPACGGGVFLVAMADALVAAGAEPRQVVDELLVGIDIDPGAVATTREALRLWAQEHGADATPRVHLGDGLAASSALDGRVDVVIGNPPFQNQLARSNAREPRERSEMTRRFGDAAKGYLDSAGLFVLRALQLAAPQAVIGLVLPRSFLATRDAAGVRGEVRSRGSVVECWIPGVRVFAASIEVCMPIIELGNTQRSTLLTAGRLASECVATVTSAELDHGTWSALFAVASGVPRVAGPDAGHAVVGDVATATAGFRDQYYGFVGHVSETPQPGRRTARLATTAMIDPGRCRWDEGAHRFAKREWRTPHVALDELDADPRLRSWVERMLRPKVIVATQTPVIEAFADLDGCYVPSTPLIAVLPDDEAPGGAVTADELATALLAPPATVWAHHHFGGAGLSARALKLAARDVARIPLPLLHEPWAAATALLAADPAAPDWRRIGLLLCEAWECDDPELLRWWLALVV